MEPKFGSALKIKMKSESLFKEVYLISLFGWKTLLYIKKIDFRSSDSETHLARLIRLIAVSALLVDPSIISTVKAQCMTSSHGKSNGSRPCDLPLSRTTAGKSLHAFREQKERLAKQGTLGTAGCYKAPKLCADISRLKWIKQLDNQGTPFHVFLPTLALAFIFFLLTSLSNIT